MRHTGRAVVFEDHEDERRRSQADEPQGRAVVFKDHEDFMARYDPGSRNR